MKSANDTAPPALSLFPLRRDLSTASSPMMPGGIVRWAVCWYTITHEHTNSRGGLEHLVDAGHPKGGALFIRPCANGLGDAFAVLLRDPFTLYAGCFVLLIFGAKVRFATHQNDGYRGTTDASNFLDPLAKTLGWKRRSTCRVTHLCRHVLEGVRCVNRECDEDDMGLGI